MKLTVTGDFEENKYWIIALYLNITLITRFVASVFAIITRRPFGSFSTILQWLLLIFPLVYFCLKAFSHTIKKSQLCIILIWGLLMFLTYVFTKPRDFLMRQAIMEGASHIVVPAILIQEVTDIDKMMKALESYVGVCTLTCVLQFLTPGLSRNAYYSFSYITFIPCAICLVNIFKRHNMSSVIAFLIIVITNFIYGGRGFYLCLAVFLVLYSWIYYRKNKAILLGVFLFFFIALAFSLFGDIIISFLSKVDINSRTILFLTGEKTDNSRFSIWNALLSEFIREPFKIRGLLADREYLAVIFHRYSEKAIAEWYSHNFIVEIIYEFGIIGIMILLIVFSKINKIFTAIKKNGNDSEILFFLLVASLFLAKMSISSSYLIDLSTGMFVGVLLIYNRLSNNG